MSMFATLRERLFGGPGRIWIPTVGTAMVLVDLALVAWVIQMHPRLGARFGLTLSILLALLVLGLAGLGVVLYSVGRRWRDAARVQQLHEDEEARLHLLASQLPADVWTTDAELRCTSVSGGLLARLKASEACVLGRTLYDSFATRELGHPVIAAHLRALRGDSATYVRTVGAVCLEARVEPLRNDRGGIIGCVGLCVDVTERKRVEAALRESEERFRVALKDSAIFVGTLDSQLRYTWAHNTRHGFRPEDVLGKRPDELIDIDEAKGMMELLREVLSSGVGKRREVSGRTRGERWCYDQIVEPLRDNGGAVVGLTLAALDITERKTVQQALSRAEDAERRRIARELHDSTGQKLASLAMTIGLFQDATTARTSPTDGLVADCLRMIDECVEDIRTLSYVLHPPLLDELGLAAAIGDYVEGFAKRSGLRVVVSVPPDLERLPTEVELALFRVMQESVTNIYRHAGASGASVSLACDAEHVTLEVSDQGRGMAAPTPCALKAGHAPSGVGIAGMRERMRLLGGRLAIESGEQGTTVRAIVPLRQEAT